jgi:hypothetical protein
MVAGLLRINDTFDTEWQVLMVVINGRGIEVAAFGDEVYFDQIIASLRPGE